MSAVHEGIAAPSTTQGSRSPTAHMPEVGQRPRRPGGGMPWPDARTRAATAALPLTAQRLPLRESSGALLAGELVALTDLPVTDMSPMDGWAAAGAPPWRVVAELPAGQLLGHRLGDGQCTAIATGAVVLDGADAVLPVERSLRDATGVHPGRRADRQRPVGTGPDPRCARPSATSLAQRLRRGATKNHAPARSAGRPDRGTGHQPCQPDHHDRWHQRPATPPCPCSGCWRRWPDRRRQRRRQARAPDAAG